MNNNLYDWLMQEYDIPAAASQPDAAGGQVPDVMPIDPNQAPIPDPNQPPQSTPSEQPVDISQDPQAPDMPEEEDDKPKDFESWKTNYLKTSIKGDVNELIELINSIRERENLTAYQRKFVEDNLNVQLLRMNSNVEKASKEIRKQIKQQLDRNNPATSVVNHLTAVLETISGLNNIFIKLNGYGGQKGDLHRKYIAALVNGVQVGSGANTEDIILNDREYSVLISTRLNSRWGDIMLGDWCLKTNDSEKFLTPPEVKRLVNGSPEEKDSLRARIIIESIADLFETRAFVINVVAEDGTIYTLGWDIATSLRAAFVDGKIVVRTKKSDDSEAMIDVNNNLVPLMDIELKYIKETGRQNENGKPETIELNFIERRNGMLFLTADLSLMRKVANSMQGMVLKETPYQGNPSDLKTLTRCVYSAHDLLMRQC